MKANGHLSANERTIESMRAKINLYSAIIMILLEDRAGSELTLSGFQLNNAEGQIMLSFDPGKDLVVVKVVEEEMKRVIS